MDKWWWRLIPGLRRRWLLEKYRIEALSDITGELLYVEGMGQRPGANIDGDYKARFDAVLVKLGDIGAKAKDAVCKSDLDDLVADAEMQGLFAAYFCPTKEIENEGKLVIDLIGPAPR